MCINNNDTVKYIYNSVIVNRIKNNVIKVIYINVQFYHMQSLKMNLNGEVDSKRGRIQKINVDLNDETYRNRCGIKNSLLVLSGGLLLLTIFIIVPLYFTVMFESVYGYIIGLVASFVVFYSAGAWVNKSCNRRF